MFCSPFILHSKARGKKELGANMQEHWLFAHLGRLHRRIAGKCTWQVVDGLGDIAWNDRNCFFLDSIALIPS